MLCLRCWQWWPMGSRYCGVCQRPFNRRLCPDDHSNPLWGPQQTCLHCNQGPLLPGTPALPMVWIPRGSAALMLLYLLYQALLHLDWILGRLCRAGEWIVCLILTRMPPGVYRTIENLIVWWICLWMLSHLLPRESGNRFRGWLGRSGQTAFRLVGRLFAMCGNGLLSLIGFCLHTGERTRHPASRHAETGHNGDGEGRTRR